MGRPAWLHGAKRHLRSAGGILKPLRENGTCFSLFVFSLMRRDQSLTAAVTTRTSFAVTRRPFKSLICSSGLLFFPSPKNTPRPGLFSLDVSLITMRRNAPFPRRLYQKREKSGKDGGSHARNKTFEASGVTKKLRSFRCTQYPKVRCEVNCPN